MHSMPQPSTGKGWYGLAIKAGCASGFMSGSQWRWLRRGLLVGWSAPITIRRLERCSSYPYECGPTDTPAFRSIHATSSGRHLLMILPLGQKTGPAPLVGGASLDLAIGS